MGESSKPAELDQMLTNFKTKPYTENAHIVITQQEVETPTVHTSDESIHLETDDFYDPNDDYQYDDEAVFTIDSDNESENDSDDDYIITDDDSDDDTIMVEKNYELIKVESDSDDDEVELLEIVSAKENTLPTVNKSRKRCHSPATNVRAKSQEEIN